MKRNKILLTRFLFSRNPINTKKIWYSNLRSFLFVPGRAKLLDKIISETQWQPDVIVPDMEDAVSVEEKENAREIIKKKLPELAQRSRGAKIIPRVNSVNTPWFEEDVKAILGPHIYGISIGKVSCPTDLIRLTTVINNNHRSSTPVYLVPWLETAEGVRNAHAILNAVPNVLGAGFGADDFLTDIGISLSSDLSYMHPLIVHAKNCVSLACHALNKLPLETPFVNYKDPNKLKMVADFAKMNIGMKGMFAIHLNQIQIINETFSPSSSDVEYALKIVQVFEKAVKEGKGTTSLDGKMIDAPIVKRAQNLLRSVGKL